MAGFDNETVYADNWDFRGVQPVVAQVTASGELPIGTGGSPAIEVGVLTSPNGTLSIGYSNPNITLDVDVEVATSYPTDSGTATPAANILNVFGGVGISTSGAGNTVTINAVSGGFNWLNIGASQSLAAQTGYFCSSGGALSLALPASSAVGDTIHVVLDGSTSWTITQGAGQRIRLGNTVSTTGAGGSLASTARGDTVTMVCQTADTFWVVINSMGNITVT